MRQDLALFAQLLIFLCGTLLYGFVTRELFRNPATLSVVPMRLLAVSLTVWYAGCLVDELLGILVPPGVVLGRFDTALDLLRGFAWLLSFPLLTHAVWSQLGKEAEGRGERPSWVWLIPGYLTLLLFLPAMARAWSSASEELAVTARSVYPLVIAHAAVASAASARLIVASLRVVRDPGLARFLRWLLGGLALVLGLLACAALALPAPGWGEMTWRLSAEASGLVLGFTFLYFVQRYSLLRLSLSLHSLRQFVNLLAMVGLVMLVGPAIGVAGTVPFHHFVAWGLLVALLVGAAAPRLERAAVDRSLWLRRLLGRGISAEEIEGLSRSLQSLSLSEDELRERTASAIGPWLAARARFLERPPARPAPAAPGIEPVADRLWRHFSVPGTHAFNRLDAPSADLAWVLQQADLQAAFPLRVAGELDAVLVLAISPVGGGYQEGEVEGVRLALAQLAAALEVRRLVDSRLAAERRLVERERLSLLGLVAASLAHELKNPLSAMKALAQTVHEELAAAAPAGEQTRDLALIVEQIDRLHGVAREILGFARPAEADGGGADLAALLRGTLYVMDHQARRRGIVLDAIGVAPVGRVQGSSATWQTVLFNLVGNALEHAPAGSTVRVSLAPRGERVELATENGGPAIPPEIAGRLFSPFASDHGTGLGLALVARRLHDLGGEIEVDNEPGRIVFRVRVQRVSPAEEAQ
jgi:signal transduction histidine kinase